MLNIHIPGREPLVLRHLVLDYNGTIALDGKVLEEVVSRLEELAGPLDIYVLTADTHGTAAAQCANLPLTLKTFPSAGAAAHKADIVRALGGGTVCVGNGYNDGDMFQVADLSICVLGREGCWGGLLARADVVVTSIGDGLDLLLHPDRLRATLRT